MPPDMTDDSPVIDPDDDDLDPDEEKLPEDNDTPYSAPTDVTDNDVPDDHPATDSGIDDQEAYDEGISDASGASELPENRQLP